MDNLVNLQGLFANNVLKVPDYQRGYSWLRENRQDLLTDLESLVSGRKHYTGTIILKKSGEISSTGETYVESDIVDGQQRITTILILLDCIVNELRKINTPETNEIASNISIRYIKYVGTQSAIYKLKLDENNDDFFKDDVIERKSGIEKKTKSHFLLHEAKEQFEKYLESKRKSGDYINFLKDHVNKITAGLMFTLYKVDDESEVGVIFEVMNDRGKPLSQLEKVKNYLIYMSDRISKDKQARDQLTHTVNFSWREILENLSRADRSDDEDENQLLRISHILTSYSEIKAFTDEDGNVIGINSQLADIHKLVKKKFNGLYSQPEQCYKKIEEYTDSLKAISSRFRDVILPNDSLSFQIIEDDQLKTDIREIASQFRRLEIEASLLPFLISSYNRYHKEPKKLIELLRLWEKFAFRIYGIGDKRPNTLQSWIYGISNDIFNDRISYSGVIDNIRETALEYVPDDDIEGYLRDPKKDYYYWDQLEYFLYEYERQRCKEVSGLRPKYEWDELANRDKKDSIEHILPEKIRSDDGKDLVPDWCGVFSPKEHEIFVKKLGNLTLTEKNSSLGNKNFTKKKTIYPESLWQIEKDIGTYIEWKMKNIEEREEKLVSFAKKRWNI